MKKRRNDLQDFPKKVEKSYKKIKLSDIYFYQFLKFQKQNPNWLDDDTKRKLWESHYNKWKDLDKEIYIAISKSFEKTYGVEAEFELNKDDNFESESTGVVLKKDGSIYEPFEWTIKRIVKEENEKINSFLRRRRKKMIKEL